MRRMILLVLGSVVVAAPAASIDAKLRAASVHVAPANAAFDAIAARYVAAVARFSPEYGTVLGDHRFDDRLSDPSAAGRARSAAFETGLLAELGRIDRRGLSRERQVDALLLGNQLRMQAWSDATLQRWAWDPQVYNDTAGGALYGLAARDFAPWPQRLKAATARMEAMPAYFAEARHQLVPVRVPREMAESVAKRNSGLSEIVDGMLEPHVGELAPADRARFEAARAGLKAAVAQHQKWLDTVLVPQAKGDFRLGPALYDQKMRFELLSSLSRTDLKARAVASMAAIRREMYDLSCQVLAGKPGAPALPATPTASQEQTAIEAALALSYAQRPARSELMDVAKADLAKATDFVRAKGLVRMPAAPVQIIIMPAFQQGTAVAYDDAPGALEKGGQNFYAISPIPAEWSEAQATSFLSEYNRFMVGDLTVHEAMPGHYLQLDHANQNKSVLRALLSSGPFVEGWAVYGEGLMADEGFGKALGDGDPLYRLTVLKMRLRSVTNTLLDIGIQTEGMTRDQAMTLMTEGAFQQEREAAGKWVRASLSSVQLLSYFIGYAEHMALRDEARRRWGAGFSLRRYHDAVLSFGSPPMRFVRELMFGLPIE
ncbi:MAG: DUF885 domain-containing protein [Sphingomicrobium sp.]